MESLVNVDARPQPLSFDLRRTAVIVVDMQNDFGSEGGMFDRAGVSIDGVKAVVPRIADVLGVARSAGMTIVYLKMQFEPDLSDAGALDGPNLLRHQSFKVGEPMLAPDGESSRILIKGTWNTEILSELAPKPEDIIVAKHRYSGFWETDLDSVLREHSVDTLVVIGCTTSICVDSTVRDAFYRDYRCVVLSDCTAEPLGSHEATLRSIEACFGWVTRSSDLLNALSLATTRTTA
jgi:ureidoacrylate peracid hydrolase